jgi:hypothetical protein
MLSDKVPDRGRVIPPQVRPPRDPTKVYTFVGGVLGIIVVFALRNCLRLPDVLSPVFFVLYIGGLELSFGLQDVVLGVIVGSALGVYFGRKRREKEELKKYHERHSEHQEKRGYPMP